MARFPSLRATGLRFLGSLLPLLYPILSGHGGMSISRFLKRGRALTCLDRVRYLLLFPLGCTHLEIFSYDTRNLIKESSKRSSVCKSRIGDWFTCTAFSNIFCTQFHVYVLSDRPGHPYVCSLAETFQKISDNSVITFSKSITIRKPQNTEPPERSWEAQRP